MKKIKIQLILALARAIRLMSKLLKPYSLGTVQIMLIILKSLNIIKWPWLYVFLPVFLGIMLVITLLVSDNGRSD